MVNSLLDWIFCFPFLMQSGWLLVFCAGCKEFLASMDCILVLSSCNFIKVNYWIQIFIFRYSINSILHTVPVLVSYECDVSQESASSLLSSFVLNAIFLVSQWIQCVLHSWNFAVILILFHYFPGTFCTLYIKFRLSSRTKLYPFIFQITLDLW